MTTISPPAGGQEILWCPHQDCLTSTEKFEEPRELFDHQKKEHSSELGNSVFFSKIEKLVKMVTKSSCVQVSKCDGGAFHHTYIVKTHENREYILRIPIFCWTKMDINAGVLPHVKQLCKSLPISDTIAYDESLRNVLGWRYSLQTRLPGIHLNDAFSECDLPTKIDLAIQFARVLADIHNVRFKGIGPLVCDPSNNLVVGEPPWDDDMQEPGSYSDTYQPSKDLVSYLSDRFDFLIEDAEGQEDAAELYEGAKQAASILLAGYSGPGKITLWHRDLHGGNILVSADNGHYKVSGVIDWDCVEAAPVEFAYEVPGWLWDQDRNRDDEIFRKYPLDYIPPEPANVTVRNAFFEEINRVIPDFLPTVKEAENRAICTLVMLARSGNWATSGYRKTVAYISNFAQEFKKVSSPDKGNEII